MVGRTHRIEIDRSKPLRKEPGTGHNRWHPDIPPILRVEAGDSVELQTRDAIDGQYGAETTAEDVGRTDLSVVHPLTGPVYVNGAEPGDLLEVQIGEITPEPFGFTVQVPGFGFLRDYFPEPYIVKWEIKDG
jgi:formamidase